MARTKASSNLLNLVESDSEDDLGEGAAVAAAAAAAKAKTKTKTAKAATTKATKQTTSIRDMPPKRSRQATAAPKASNTASKITKPAQKKESAAAIRRRAAAAAAVIAEEAAGAAAADRQVLADRTNEQLEEAAAPAKAKGRGRSGRKATAAAAAPAAEDGEDTEAEAAAKAEETAKSRGRGRPKAGAPAAKDENKSKEAPKAGRRKAAAAGKTAAAEEEGESMEQDETAEAVEGFDQDEVTQQEPDSMDVDEKAGEETPMRRSQPAQRPSSALRGKGVAVSSDPTGDAAVRRRLGDLTKKHDSLEVRFQKLRDVGVTEAERNFDRLKKQGDERVKISDELIASLRAELATYRDLAKEGARAKREWDACEARAADLQGRVDQLTAALGDAKAEARSLTTKLAAARTSVAEGVAAGAVAGVVPGSAMKKMGHGGLAADRAAAAAAAAASQVVQLKENLYGDLTGLLVYSARRDGSRELYDCIQTGRSGSLHFKLCIDNDSSSNSNGREGDDDDESQFVYMPQLDASRDADLISRLPDYLVEEISFPRAQAAKFYSRVVQSLMAEK